MAEGVDESRRLKSKLKYREQSTVMAIYNEPKQAVTGQPRNHESANDGSAQISGKRGIGSDAINYITVGKMQLLFEFYVNMSLKSEASDFSLCLHLLPVCLCAGLHVCLCLPCAIQMCQLRPTCVL